jgi:hypothetical protein
MRADQFCYWLQGFFEIVKVDTTITKQGAVILNKEQINIIQNHLNMVFLHDLDKQVPHDQQKPLNDLHQGGAGAPGVNINDVKVRC